ncbi:Stress-associated protein 5 [Heracleum sosnowskyi]|uniref:Stress-associated protein 5 n=1 Tax=Heracleum sosnowskyi TaxID=360622 RepID=A0AAD8J750_9APIA|nr:Stress-associated protein 5 [Heracleum sosnowskyi]
MEAPKETGCQAPEGPILCVNNCGFFGSAATMNMCSKCHKDMILKQEQAKLAATSIENIVNGGSGSTDKDPAVADAINLQAGAVESKINPILAPRDSSSSNQNSEVKVKVGPNRCSACRKRVGLTGFSCRCGNLYCADHRYSDKHECSFDYRTAAKDAITKANPIVKAEKLDKI